MQNIDQNVKVRHHRRSCIHSRWRRKWTLYSASQSVKPSSASKRTPCVGCYRCFIPGIGYIESTANFSLWRFKYRDVHSLSNNTQNLKLSTKMNWNMIAPSRTKNIHLLFICLLIVLIKLFSFFCLLMKSYNNVSIHPRFCLGAA